MSTENHPTEALEDLQKAIAVESLHELAHTPKSLCRPNLTPAEIAEQIENSFLVSLKLKDALDSIRTWLHVMAGFYILSYAAGFAALIYGVYIEIRVGAIELLAVTIASIIYLFPLTLMFTYASRIGKFCKNNDPDDFLNMLSARRVMWIVFGWYALLFLVLCCVSFVILGLFTMQGVPLK